MKQKTGLVMEGGAMRGLFTAGIIDVLMEQEIEADGVIGISAGATFGCNYLTKQTGDMFGAKFCYETIPLELDIIDNDTFVRQNVPFYVAATDVHTGRAVYHQCKDVISPAELDWIRASASMPLASQIVRAGNYELLDGGIADSIPLKYMEYKGYARNIVILTQPLGYLKQPNSTMPLVRTVYRDYPALIRAMERRHIAYNRQLEYIAAAEAEGRAFVIRPPRKLPIAHVTHSAERMREVYAIGRQTALTVLPALRSFLAENE